MRTILRITTFIIFSLYAGNLFSQEYVDTTKKDDKLYIVVKNDGTQYVGKIISQDAREVLLETADLGQIYIPKHEIKEIREVKAGELDKDGQIKPSELFATRYFITTNGLPLEKGDSYILWNLFGPDFQFGVGKNFSIGVMTTWVAVPIVGSIKYSFSLSEDFHIGVGGLIGTSSWASFSSGGNFGIGLPYGVLSYGNSNGNLSFSGGYGAVWADGDSQGRALLSVAGMKKVGKKVSLVFDSFIVPPGNPRTITTYNSSGQPITTTQKDPGFSILLPGLRFQTDVDKAFQFGFGGIVIDGEMFPAPIPFVQWFRKI